MKLLIETTGSFMLVDPETGTEIHHNRPTVAPMSNFVTSRMAKGELKLLSNELSDEATDAEFATFAAESEDMDLAVSSFVAKFGPQPVDPKAEAKAKAEAEAAAKAKAKAEAEAAKPKA